MFMCLHMASVFAFYIFFPQSNLNYHVLNIRGKK